MGGVSPHLTPPLPPPESPACYSNKELKGMLVWAPNHRVSDAKREPPPPQRGIPAGGGGAAGWPPPP